jgi:raffinose/stachyose/melibiose transport system permease protein
MYQTLLVLPMVVPAIVGYMIWKWFYSYEGLLNIVLAAVGQEQVIRAWLGDPDLALYALMFVGFPWAGGFNMLVFLAGLQQISSEVIDAAIVDGAGTLSRFLRIELPLVSGQVRFLLILSIIHGIQQFTLPLVMTSGGPGWATMVPGLRLLQTVTHEFQYGYGSAIGVALFVVILGLTYLNQRYLRSTVEYEPTR